MQNHYNIPAEITAELLQARTQNRPVETAGCSKPETKKQELQQTRKTIKQEKQNP